MTNKSSGSGLIKKLVLASSIALTSLGTHDNARADDILSNPANPANPASPLNPLNDNKSHLNKNNQNNNFQVSPFAYAGLIISIGAVGYYIYKTRFSGDIF